jgi:hypothetical protein
LWQLALFVVRGPKAFRQTVSQARNKSPLGHNCCIQRVLVGIPVVIELDHAIDELLLLNRTQLVSEVVVLIGHNPPNQLLPVVEGVVEIKQDCFDNHVCIMERAVPQPNSITGRLTGLEVPMRKIVFTVFLVVIAMSGGWLLGQSAQRSPELKSGSDIAIRVEGRDRSGKLVGTLMVRSQNGEWTEISLGRSGVVPLQSR